jgi:hypothetical protein
VGTNRQGQPEAIGAGFWCKYGDDYISVQTARIECSFVSLDDAVSSTRRRNASVGLSHVEVLAGSSVDGKKSRYVIAGQRAKPAKLAKHAQKCSSTSAPEFPSPGPQPDD